MEAREGGALARHHQSKVLVQQHSELCDAQDNRLPVWKDLLQVKQIYMRGRSINTKNGNWTLFWKDTWISQRPLCVLYPVLFDLCEEKNITVYQFLVKDGNLQFTRWLSSLLFEQWMGVIDLVYSFPFGNQDDVILWKFHFKICL